MSKKVVIVSKELCQGCNSLKLFLRAALKSKYDQHIEHVKLEENPDKYLELAEELETTQVPTLALLEDGKYTNIIRGFQPDAVKRLFEENFND